MSQRIAARRSPFFRVNRRERRNSFGLYWRREVDAMIEKALLADVWSPHRVKLEDHIGCRNGL